MPEKIWTETMVDRKYLAPGKSEKAYVMVRLSAPVQEVKNENRTVQNLGFVIDHSGSMAGPKLSHAKRAVNFAAGHLNGGDYISVVAFDDRITTVLPSTRAENKDLIKAAVNHIEDGGTTNLSGGMLAGFKEVQKQVIPGQTNRVLLLTDGWANEGITDHDQLVEMAGKLVSGGVTLSALGLGEGFEEDLLIRMADTGRGNFYYIESPDLIPGIFEQELDGLLSIMAQNVQLKYVPGPSVTSARVMGYPSEFENGAIRLSLPDVYCGEEKIILFELHLAPQEAGACRLGSLELEYADVRDELAMVSLKIDIKLSVTDSPELEGPLENYEVIKQVELYRAAEAREEAVRLADQGDFTTSQAVLESQFNKLAVMADEFGDSDLMAEASEIKENLEQVDGAAYNSVSRKRMVYQSYRNKRSRRGK